MRFHNFKKNLKIQASFEVLEGVERTSGLGSQLVSWQRHIPVSCLREEHQASQVCPGSDRSYTCKPQAGLYSGLDLFSRSFHSLHSCTELPWPLHQNSDCAFWNELELEPTISAWYGGTHVIQTNGNLTQEDCSKPQTSHGCVVRPYFLKSKAKKNIFSSMYDVSRELSD